MKPDPESDGPSYLPIIIVVLVLIFTMTVVVLAHRSTQ